MYSIGAAVYKGKDSKKEAVGYISSEGFYCVASGKNKVDAAELDTFLQNIKHRMTTERVAHLSEFETIFDEQLNQVSSKDTSISAALFVGDIVYLLSRGGGEAYVHRNGVLQKLIGGNNVASGKVDKNDGFVITTHEFFESVEKGVVEKHLQQKGAKKLVDEMSPELEKIENPVIAAFLKAGDEAPEDIPDVAETPIEEVDEGDIESEAINVAPTEDTEGGMPTESFAPRSVTGKKKLSMPKMKLPGNLRIQMPESLRSTSRGKQITMGITVVLLIVFLWSVGLGNSRRQQSAFVEKVQTAQTEINASLDKVNDIKEDDPIKALELIDGAESIYDSLKDEADENNFTDIEELSAIASRINSARQGVNKAEEAPSDEFYDLTLIDSDAQATKLYLSGDELAMLDSENGNVYILTIDDKSVDTVSDGAINDAKYVSMHQGNVFVFTDGDGIVKIEDGDSETVVRDDKDWDGIQDMWMYSGNIYLLAAGNNEVYKYLVAEEGYSDKNSYFLGGPTNLSTAKALAIDGSIFIAEEKNVRKYVAGLQEDYEANVPSESSTFEDIFTSIALDNVYVLDKDNGAIFIFNKDGEFQKQVTSSVIKKADDFVVDEEAGILVLSKDKIYNIELNQ